jgi:dUTP pyrophosphatase
MTKEVLIKKLRSTVNLPIYKTPGSSGLDLEAALESKNEMIIKPGETGLVPTGIAVALPENMELQIRPRSGLSLNSSITVLNTPGTVDSDYRGEIKVILINHGKKDFIIKSGDRIAQMVFCPILKPKMQETEELPDTIRKTGGFGSTGKN